MNSTKGEKDKTANIALWLYPILLIAPNVILAFTEDWPLLYKIADISIMFGVYLAVMSLSRKVGLTIVLCLPIVVYAAFQIVLIYLYGSGIIAVDMLINVVTTNAKEVSELLGNLKVAMLTVFAMYLPPIVWAVYALARHKVADASRLRYPRIVGLGLMPIGLALTGICYYNYPDYDFTKYTFPVNTVSNTFEAVKRTCLTKNYAQTSEQFSYQVKDMHAADDKEVYVLVVGETSRADNWQLMGYGRHTNPRLSRRSHLLAFPKAMSESNTTHKSVPMILSPLDAHTYGDSVYSTKSIITAFAEAGYATAFISAQMRNRSFIDFYGAEADRCRFIVEEGEEQCDANLLPYLKQLLDTVTHNKVFVVLHTYGSHFSYNDRYPHDMAHFVPCDYLSAEKGCRDKLINAYDNAIRYTDYFLDQICSLLSAEGLTAAMLYVSDHGEDIFDDERGRFLHASPTPTYYQLHVPMLMWMSDEYVDKYVDKYSAGQSNLAYDVDSSEAAFHTMLDMAGISTPRFSADKSLVSPTYRPHERYYLNDYNECASLQSSGLKRQDYVLINRMSAGRAPNTH